MAEAIKNRLRWIKRLIRNQLSARLEVEYYGSVRWRLLDALCLPLRVLRGRERGQQARQNAIIDQLVRMINDDVHGDKPNIVIINSYFPPNTFGGSTRVAMAQLEELIEQFADSYRFWVICAAPTELRPFELALSAWHGAPVVQIGTPLHPRPEWHYADEKILAIARRIFERTRPSLVHAHSVQRLTTAPLIAAKALGIPYVVTVHDSWWINDEQFRVLDSPRIGDDPIALQSTTNPQKAKQRIQSLRNILNAASKVIGVSEYQAALYRDNSIDDVVVIENGVVHTRPITRHPSDDIRFLYAGGIAKHKGYEWLRRSISEVADEQWLGVVVDFSLAGEVRDETWGKARVALRGMIDQTQWPSVFAGTDIVFIPSLVDESYGLLAREAVMAGVWVVVSDAGALRECVEHGVNGWVIQREDPSSLEAVIALIAANPDRIRTTPPREIADSIASPAKAAAQIAKIYRGELV